MGIGANEKFSRGEKLKASELNDIIAAVFDRMGKGAGLHVKFDGKHHIVSLDETRVRQIAGTGSGGGPFPFRTRAVHDKFESLCLNVHPGSIGGVVPFIADAELGNVKLNNDPRPTGIPIYASADPLILYYRGWINTLDPALQFRSHVATAEIVKSTDSDVDTDCPVITEATDPDFGGRRNYVMKWDGDNLFQTGKFYIKIASARITINPLGKLAVGNYDSGTFKGSPIDQLLYTGYQTYALTPSEIVPLV